MTRGRRPLRVAGGALVVAFLAAACSGSGYHYVKSSDDRTYFKVPDAWKLYDEEQVLKARSENLSPRQQATERETSWRVMFDASPRPSLAQLPDLEATHPNGIAIVQELDFDSSDSVSLAVLRNFFIDVDGALQNGQGDIVAYEPLEPDGGFRGFHLVAEVVVADLETQESHVVTIDQTMLLDQATSKLYALLVTCDAQCYEDNADQIERVVESWTVRE